MENIIIGGIVGGIYALAIALYKSASKSSKFSDIQRIILFFLIIFPPLFFVLYIPFYIYNSIKYSRNKEIKQHINFQNSTSTMKNNFLYFIVENGKQSENPLTFEELKEKRISEHTFIWRNGLEAWLPAKDLSELHSILVFSPPPFKFDKSEKQEISTPPPFNL